MPPRTSVQQFRLYVAVGALVAVGCGAVLAQMLELPSGWPQVVWYGLTGAIGVVLGWMLVLAQRPADTPPSEPSGEPSPLLHGDDGVEREGGTRKMQFFALGSNESSSRLRPMRVRRHTAPMAPPDLELRLLLEEYDHTARVAVAPGVLENRTAAELCERAMEEAHDAAPAPSGSVDLTLVAYRSEGVLTDDGRCPDGWTFFAVDGRIGMACTATATRHEIALRYSTSPTHYVPSDATFVDPADALAVVRESLPELLDAGPVRVRFNLPADLHVFREEPIIVATVDVAGGGVRNASAVRELLESAADEPRGERWTLDAVLAWWRGGEAEPGSELADALADESFRTGLRTFDAASVRRTADAVARAHGADATERVVAEILAATDGGEREELLHLLAHIPGGLAAPALQRLAAGALEGDARDLAATLFGNRVRGALDVPANPLDTLDFEALRARMGKRGLVPVPLLSTYDPESDLLEPLEEVGLRVTRARRLCGESDLLLAAYLRPSRGATEGLITSTPLPVPCHVLHLVGSAAESFAQRIERAGLTYNDEQIRADVASRSPWDIHRGSLYMAALRMDFDGAADALFAGHERGRTDANLCKAILHALEFVDDARVDGFLADRARVGEEDERALAKRVLARRNQRASAEVPAEPSDEETPAS